MHKLKTLPNKIYSQINTHRSFPLQNSTPLPAIFSWSAMVGRFQQWTHNAAEYLQNKKSFWQRNTTHSSPQPPKAAQQKTTSRISKIAPRHHPKIKNKKPVKTIQAFYPKKRKTLHYSLSTNIPSRTSWLRVFTLVEIKGNLMEGYSVIVL